MALYKGEVFQKFLIDRSAMGFDFSSIKAEFDELYGIPLKEADYEAILSKCEDAVREREQELIKEMKDENIFRQLYAIKKQLEEAREIALTNNDLKSYAALTNQSLKSIEVTLNGIDMLRKKDQKTINIIQVNNYGALDLLAKDGYITLNKPAELRQLLGVKEEVVDVTPPER